MSELSAEMSLVLGALYVLCDSSSILLAFEIVPSMQDRYYQAATVGTCYQ